MRTERFLPVAWAILMATVSCEKDPGAPEEAEWCDSATLLCWQDPHSGTPAEWQQAVRYCEDLIWNGHTNWRLPTLLELRTLVERCPATGTGGSCEPGRPGGDCLDGRCASESCAGCPAGEGPDQGSGGCYWPQALNGPCTGHWSSTRPPDLPDAAWIVSFVTAQVTHSPTGATMPVRCVRPMPVEEDLPDAIEDLPDAEEEDAPDNGVPPDLVPVDPGSPDPVPVDFVTSDPGSSDPGGSDLATVDTIPSGPCSEDQKKCEDDRLYRCGTNQDWELEEDCWEFWHTCGTTSYGQPGCVEYPDCTAEQVGGRCCWRSRALKCVTGGIDWQLQDDCARYQDMHCETQRAEFTGRCLHDGGLTWVDPDTGIEWQRPVFPDHEEHFANWLDAKAYCDGLVWGDPPRDDWRLPTISELRTLVRGCPGTMTGGSCAYTDACREDCWEGDCWGCDQWKGPTLLVSDPKKGAYIRPEFQFEFAYMSWSMYLWSGSRCQYYTDRPEAQVCRIDFRNGAVEVKYHDADLAYPVCVRDR